MLVFSLQLTFCNFLQRKWSWHIDSQEIRLNSRTGHNLVKNNWILNSTELKIGDIRLDNRCVTKSYNVQHFMFWTDFYVYFYLFYFSIALFTKINTHLVYFIKILQTLSAKVSWFESQFQSSVYFLNDSRQVICCLDNKMGSILIKEKTT